MFPKMDIPLTNNEHGRVKSNFSLSFYSRGSTKKTYTDFLIYPTTLRERMVKPCSIFCSAACGSYGGVLNHSSGFVHGSPGIS